MGKHIHIGDPTQLASTRKVEPGFMRRTVVSKSKVKFVPVEGGFGHRKANPPPRPACFSSCNYPKAIKRSRSAPMPPRLYCGTGAPDIPKSVQEIPSLAVGKIRHNAISRCNTSTERPNSQRKRHTPRKKEQQQDYHPLISFTAHETEKLKMAELEVVDFLEELNLLAYGGVLLDEGYDDLRSLITLTETDLVEMGFKKGHRARLIHAVSDISQIASSDDIMPDTLNLTNSSMNITTPRGLSPVEPE
eukprot:TRINITY_DN180_c3_g1_i1.p1 TRINITY_DN180_c3_g1~~TRINITY_DN180_c3_g1_i1.p1  ORF type:complete len:255 (+),score=19.18 TRINITY_DN180_c3_g1_i1:27-767(+)